MKRLLTLLAFSLLSLSISVSAAAAASPLPPSPTFLGPADLRNQRPYALLFLTFAPETARVLPRGRQVFALQLDVANDLLIPARTPQLGIPFVEEDAETQRLGLTERLGLGGRLEVAGFLPVIARDGGALDPIIEAYHRAAGFANSTVDTLTGRTDIPDYRSVVRLLRPDGSVEVDAGHALGLGDMSGTVKYSLSESARTALAVRAGLKLPTGDAGRLLGSGAADAGLDLDAQAALAPRVALYVSGGYVWMGHDRDISTAATHDFQLSESLEYRASAHDFWLLQSQGGGVVVRTGNAHADGPQRIVSVVYRRLTGPHTVWTFAFTENGDIVNYRAPWLVGIGPDVSVTAGVSWSR